MSVRSTQHRFTIDGVAGVFWTTLAIFVLAFVFFAALGFDFLLLGSTTTA